MTKIYPLFVFRIGLMTTFGFFPHMLFLIFLLFMGMNLREVYFLVVSTLGARALIEWFFWSAFASKIDSEGFKHWLTLVNYSSFSQPHVAASLFFMLFDTVVDVLLVYISLKTLVSPVWIFLPFLICHMLSTSIWGMISDYFSRKTGLLISLVVIMLAVIVILKINNGVEHYNNSTCYFK